jgi:hypothetical protein
MEPKKYKTETAFRRALEDRLKEISRKEDIAFERLRRQVAFDRLLARFFHSGQSPWLLKGGYAMELRIRSARTTKDIDLTVRRKLSMDAIPDLLQESASADLSDYFSYTVGRAMMDLAGPIYGGARYPVEARMDGRTFARFHVDVALGDPPIEPFEVTQGRDWLGFAGIPRPDLRMISREQQFAEKLHAYTVPRKGAVNTRVRDLVDMVLLINTGTLDGSKVTHALSLTFDRRQTHPIPASLPAPPADWQKPFTVLAKECALPESMDQAFQRVEAFLRSLQ